MATGKTCPHGPEDRLTISGTQPREMLAKRETVPHDSSRPEVLEVLQAYCDRLDR